MYIPKRSVADDEAQDSPDLDKQDFEDIQREQESASFLRHHSNVERIEGAAREYTFQAMKLLAGGNEDLLDRNIMLHNLEAQQKRNIGLLSLPFSLLFFFSFAYSAFQHEDVTNRYLIETGLSTVLAKGASDISNIAETWDWLNTTLFPIIFNQKDSRGIHLDDKLEWSRVLSYNSLVGPLFIEQERSEKAICKNDESGISDNMYCYDMMSTDHQPFGRKVPWFQITAPKDGEYKSDNITMKERIEYYNRPFAVAAAGPKGPKARRLRTMVPTYQDRLSGGELSAGIGDASSYYRAMFFPNMEYSLLQERLNYLYEREWLDKQTKHITIYATFLNVEMGRPRLQSYMLTLSFARSGDVFRKLRLDTIFLNYWSGFTSYAADGVFAVMLVIVTSLEARAMIRERKKRKLWKYVRTGWFLLQVTTAAMGWIILLGYLYSNNQLGPVKKELDYIVAARDADTPAARNFLGDSFIDTAGKYASFAGNLAIAVAQYHLLLMMRFFVAFRAQPRLGVVVNTLEACMLDILHFLVILGPSGVAYAISGCFIFGKRLEEFSDIKAAIGICFEIMVESNYEWPSLSEEHYWTAALWVWSFMIFLAVLMLNMVLAIILDVYSEQRKSAGKSENVIETFTSFYTVFKNRDRWVGTKKAIAALKTAPRMFSREEFLKLFPGMVDQQANIIISDCLAATQNIHAGPDQMKHTMRMAMALKVAMDQVAEAVDELDSGSYRPTDGVPELKQENWINEINKEMASQNHAMMSLQWQLQQLNWQWQSLDMAHGKGTVFNVSAVDAPKATGKIL